MPNVGPTRDPVWAILKGGLRGQIQMQFMAHSCVKGQAHMQFMAHSWVHKFKWTNMPNVGPYGAQYGPFTRGVYRGQVHMQFMTHSWGHFKGASMPNVRPIKGPSTGLFKGV